MLISFELVHLIRHRPPSESVTAVDRDTKDEDQGSKKPSKTAYSVTVTAGEQHLMTLSTVPVLDAECIVAPNNPRECSHLLGYFESEAVSPPPPLTPSNSLSLSLSLFLFLSLSHTHTHSLTHSLTPTLSLTQ